MGELPCDGKPLGFVMLWVSQALQAEVLRKPMEMNTAGSADA